MIEPTGRIRIELQEIEPKVSRRVDVPLSATLSLHDIIQVTMGWTGSHLFEFVVGDKGTASRTPTTRCTSARSTGRGASAAVSS